MKAFEARLKKIEERFLSNNKIIVQLTYSGAKENFVIINGIQYDIPPDIDPDNFVSEKAKYLRGVIVCSLYLSKN